MDPQTNQQRVNPQLVKLIMVIVLVVFVGALVVAFLNRGQVVTESDDFSNSDFDREAVVTLTHDGFEPASLTVSSHTRVSFKSGDGETHVLVLNNPNQQDGPATSPANDPQLPNTVDLLAGQSVMHVFERADTYYFHDQNDPTHNVSVTVQ